MPRRSNAATVEPDQGEGLSVFLSYNTKDGKSAAYLNERLREVGFDPFFGEWSLVPGDQWPVEVAAALDRSRAFVFLAGIHGLGRWQGQELQVALEKKTRNPEYRVIPVLLPRSRLPETGVLPLFLLGYTWVDFRKRLRDPEALRRLIYGLRGASPGSLPGSIEPGRCPYRGLEAFQEEDHPFFCGRGAVIQQILEGFRDGHALLTILGGSGSGKSSLVRAGLIPALRSGTPLDSGKWTILSLRPGAHPAAELAAELEKTWSSVSEPWEGLLQTSAPRRGRTLRVRIESCLRRTGSDRLVLVIDQFEELFTLCTVEERMGFLDLLLDAAPATGGAVVLVIALRNDFYGRAAEHPRLAERLTECAVPIPPMTIRELRQAIEGPAELVGLQIERELGDRILQDMERQPEALPLLEHALLELYERCCKGGRGNRLTYAAYEEIGGIHGAIGERAEEAYGKLTKQEKRVARRIFLRLVQPGDGTADVRRQALLSELALLPDGDLVAPVIDRLVNARLLTWQSNARKEIVVDLIHEALVREWKRLQEWINQDRKALLALQDLARWAREWERLGKKDDLLGESKMVLVEEWAGSYADQMNDLERRFLEAGRNLKKEREQEEKRRLEARLGVQRRIIGLLLVAVLAMSWAGWMIAKVQSARAETRRQARVGRSSALSVKAAVLAESRPLLGVLLALEAAHAVPETIAAQASLRNVLARLGGDGLVALPEGLQSLVLSPDARWLAAVGRQGEARLWNLVGAVPREIVLPGGGVHSSLPAFSRDGKRLAVGTLEGATLIWDLRSAPLLVARTVPTGSPVQTLAFSTDGRWLAVAESRVVRVRVLSLPGAPEGAAWRLPEDSGPLAVGVAVINNSIHLALGGLGGLFLPRGLPPVVAAGPTTILCLGLSPDGHRFAAGDGEGRLYLGEWTTEDSAPALRIWNGHAQAVVALAFSSEGRRLATASLDGAVRLWDPAAPGSLPVLLRGHTRSVGAVAFSSDGRRLATGDGDGKIFLWDLKTEDPGARPTLLHGHEGMVRALAFDPSGHRHLLSVAADGQVRRWDLTFSEPVVTPWELVRPASGEAGGGVVEEEWEASEMGLRLHRPDGLRRVGQIAFDPAGKWLVAGLGTQEAALWRLGLPVPAAQVLSGRGLDEIAAFAPRGSRLAVGRSDGKILLRSLAGGDSLLAGHQGSVTALAFSPNGRWLASGGREGRVRLWRMDRRPAPAGHLALAAQLPVRGIEISADSRWLAVTHEEGGRPGELRLWRLDARTPSASWYLLSAQSRTLAVARFTPDARWLITASHDGAGCLWELRQAAEQGLRCRPLVSPRSNAGPIRGLAVSPDSRWLATGRGQNLSTELWDLSADAPSEYPVLLQEGGPIQVAAFSPDGHWLAMGIGGADTPPSLRLWDLTTDDPSQKAWTLPGPALGVTALAFGGRGRWLSVGARDGVLRLWDLKSGEPGVAPPLELARHAERVTTLGFSPDGRWLASADLSGAVRLWAVTLDDLTDLACRTVGRSLTREEWDHYLPGEPYRPACRAGGAGRRALW